MHWLARFHDIAYLLLRVVSGLMFAIHGSQKLFGVPPGQHGTVPLASIYGLSGVIELVAGILIAVGLLTRLAAFIASGEMAVAYFMAHAPNGFWPIQNQGELAVLYCFLFLCIATHGGGRYSVDGSRSAGSTPRAAL